MREEENRERERGDGDESKQMKENDKERQRNQVSHLRRSSLQAGNKRCTSGSASPDVGHISGDVELGAGVKVLLAPGYRRRNPLNGEPHVPPAGVEVGGSSLSAEHLPPPLRDEEASKGPINRCIMSLQGQPPMMT